MTRFAPILGFLMFLLCLWLSVPAMDYDMRWLDRLNTMAGTR
jgi:hypothetical protein